MMIPPPKPDKEPTKPAKKAPKSIIRVNVKTVIVVCFLLIYKYILFIALLSFTVKDKNDFLMTKDFDYQCDSDVLKNTLKISSYIKDIVESRISS
ncbi:hypothetical protein D3C84_1143800 [compost metagenome]